MFLSKRPNGFYFLFYKKSNGKRTCISTHTKLKSEANKFLIDFSNRLKISPQEKVLEISLKHFTDEFAKYSEVVHTYWTNYTYKQTFKFLNEYFPKRLLSKIKIRDINKYIQHRIKTGPIYQARKDLINISAAFKWAIFQGYLYENPCKKN